MKSTSTIRFFKQQLALMESQAGVNEYVQVIINGIEAVKMSVFSDDVTGEKTLVVAGPDPATGIESVFVFPAAQFIAQLSLVPRKESKRQIGFVITDEGG